MKNRFIVTGWVWFIGSTIVWYLNRKWIEDIIIVDELDTTEKWQTLVGKKYSFYYDKDEFLELVLNNNFLQENDIVIHMWACSATTETDSNYLMNNNTKYTWNLYKQAKYVWARLIYASSAATYGDGENGYNDNNFDLKPLNMYGYSKHLFDQWLIKDTNNFTKNKNQVVWLKFFNVYWPNEYFKWKMASVVFHWFNQVKSEWKIKLFKSYKEWFKDGEQKRDFIYVKDILKIIDFFIENKDKSWIFNVWTWKARTFKDLAIWVFKALNLEPNIEYIEMPESLRPKYQYFTESSMDKLKNIWYKQEFYSLEEWIKDYVQNYLDKWFKIY